MSNYYLDHDRRKSYNRRQRAKRTLLFVGLLIVLFIIILALYLWQNSNGKTGPVVIKPPTKSYYAGAPKRVFSTDRFKFEATSNWQLSNEESLGSTKYVYFTHSLNNNLVEFELRILFDKSLDGQAVNYVMPVTLSGSSLKSGPMSGRCGDELVSQKGNAAPNTMQMTYQGASYICAVRGSGEKAAASLVGGNYDISMNRPNGQIVVVNFGFNNNSSSYFGQAFKEVLDSFTLK